MTTLGIIPARSGSKRVPNKSIRPLAGIPLIGYTIDAAKEASSLDAHLVSTDSQQYADIATQLGGNAPFLRPEQLAGDDSGDFEVIMHAVDWYESTYNDQVDIVVYLRPTSPFKTSGMIDAAVNLLHSGDVDCVRSMTKSQGVHHPYWMFTKDENGNALPFDANNTIDKYYQSQLLPEVFRLNGVVDAYRVSALKKLGEMPVSNMGILEIDEKSSMDIDTEFDFKLCEMLVELG